MRNILKIASLLDESGLYILSDKLFKFAQSTPAQIADANRPYTKYPTNPKNINELRNQVLRTDFRGEIYQSERGDSRFNTSDLRSFAVGLMNHAISNKFSSIKAAFDDYANKGAKFRGKNIQNVPEIVELYKRVSNFSGSITSGLLEDELRNIFSNPKIKKPQSPNQNNQTPLGTNTPNNFNNNYDTFYEQSSPTNNSRTINFSLHSNDPKSFANNLLDYMESRNYERDGNLTKAFNDYADAGATYNGESIKNIPALVKVYNTIASTKAEFKDFVIEDLVDQALKNQEIAPLYKTIIDNINSNKLLTPQQKADQIKMVTGQ